LGALWRHNDNMASSYLQHGVYLHLKWRLLTLIMASAYLQHDVYLPLTWLLLTFNMAMSSTYLQHGIYLPSTWRLLTFNMASTYLFNHYEFWLSLCKIVRSSVILLFPFFTLSCYDTVFILSFFALHVDITWTTVI
jgi:hypothetical protein